MRLWRIRERFLEDIDDRLDIERFGNEVPERKADLVKVVDVVAVEVDEEGRLTDEPRHHMGGARDQRLTRPRRKGEIIIV